MMCTYLKIIWQSGEFIKKKEIKWKKKKKEAFSQLNAMKASNLTIREMEHIFQ